jgi:gamma-glutamylcysteine synthetase
VVLRRVLWTLGLGMAICGPSGAVGWATAHEMVQAQYLMVGRYMAAHFERAAAMAEAVQVRANNNNPLG